MKNYDEMARNVLQRRDAYVQKQNRRRRIAGICVECACVVAVLSIGIFVVETKWNIQDRPHLNNPQIFETTPSNQIPTHVESATSGANVFSLLLSAEPGEKGTTLEKNLVLPMNYKLTISDIRGMDQAGVMALREQHKYEIETELNKYRLDDNAAWLHYSMLKRENYLISLVRIGSFQLYVEDFDAVESIRVTNGTPNGEMDIFFSAQNYYEGSDITLKPEQIPENAKGSGLKFNWSYTNVMLQELEKDPTADLSQFSDTVTFTVAYKNGDLQHCKIDILILEDGSICAVLRETSMSA